MCSAKIAARNREGRDKWCGEKWWGEGGWAQRRQNEGRGDGTSQADGDETKRGCQVAVRKGAVRNRQEPDGTSREGTGQVEGRLREKV